jgi:hypothetical protein
VCGRNKVIQILNGRQEEPNEKFLCRWRDNIKMNPKEIRKVD